MGIIRLIADMPREVRTRIVTSADQVVIEFYGSRRGVLETLTLTTEEASELAEELEDAALEASFGDDDE